MALFHSLRADDTIFITPWRHLKNKGGPIVDLGVHFTDLIRYQLGDIAEVYGDVWLIEPVRKKQDQIGDTYTFYQQRFKAMASEVPATAEDTSVAMFKMESGATVKLDCRVGRARQLWRSTDFGVLKGVSKVSGPGADAPFYSQRAERR